MVAEVILLKNVRKAYGRVQALRDVDLSIQSGGITAILGPNGAGKTTFINILLGLVRASSGKAMIMGAKPGTTKARQQIGAMLQDTDLPEFLTVCEHIELFAAYYDTPRSVEETLELAGLRDLARRPYAKLSGGQKRRVQFAAAIVGNPKLVFLDEPTTGLDPDARKKLWDVVASLKAQGVTIIMTTHYLEEADALADRVVMIADGAVVADGPIEDIRASVGGKRMSFVADAPDGFWASLPDIQSAWKNGRYTEIMVRDPMPVIKAMLAADIYPEDLTIKGAGLEEAFYTLTGQKIKQKAAAA